MAREALERARATLDGKCPMCGLESGNAKLPELAEWSQKYGTGHISTASLFLDGLSVAAVTRAERELDR